MGSLDKAIKVRINSWVKQLSQITSVQEWKKNRNLYAILLLNMVINQQFVEPFDKLPKGEDIPILSQLYVNSLLTPKFWKKVKNKIDINSYNLKIISNEKHENYKINMESKNKNYITNLQNNNESTSNYNISNKNESTSLFENNENKILPNFNFENMKLENLNLMQLKGLFEKLQNYLDQKEIVIAQQEDERLKLLEKIRQLEEIVSAFNENLED